MWLSGLAIARMLLKRLVCFEKEEGCFSKDMNSGSDCFCEEHLKEVRHLWLEKKKSLNVESFIIWLQYKSQWLFLRKLTQSCLVSSWGNQMPQGYNRQRAGGASCPSQEGCLGERKRFEREKSSGQNESVSSVQSLSRVPVFATPWIAARQASLSITYSQSSPKVMCIKSVIPSSHLILCRPFLLLPPVPPSIMVFSNESTLHVRY